MYTLYEVYLFSATGSRSLPPSSSSSLASATKRVGSHVCQSELPILHIKQFSSCVVFSFFFSFSSLSLSYPTATSCVAINFDYLISSVVYLTVFDVDSTLWLNRGTSARTHTHTPHLSTSIQNKTENSLTQIIWGVIFHVENGEMESNHIWLYRCTDVQICTRSSVGGDRRICAQNPN